MPYTQIDESFYDHPKALWLLDQGDDGLAAIGLWSLVLLWAKRQADPTRPELAGRVPASLPRRLVGDSADRLAQLLVDARAGRVHGLWERAFDGRGWVIHDFAFWQELGKWAARSSAAKRAAAARWTPPAATLFDTEALTSDADASADASPDAYANGSAPASPDASAGGRAAGRAGGQAGAMPSTEQNRTMHEDTRPANADRFDEFWASYPRKTAKAEARKAWAQVTGKGADPQAIISGAARYTADPNRPPAQFTPHPATWLRGERWNDGPCPPRFVAEEPGVIERRPEWEGRPR